jgi:C-terminal processing protease CtpA/Prc
VKKVFKIRIRYQLLAVFKQIYQIPFIFLLLFTSCSKDEVTPDPVIPTEIQSINNFIWENMDLYYLWRDFMPANLDPERQPEPAEYFHKLLYRQDDRWSFITDDYDGLLDKFQGINKTYGHEFKLFRKRGSKDVYGIVEYVIKNSPAKEKGIKRGDIFDRINGVYLDTLNYRSLLFGNDTYTVGFADLIDKEVISNNKEIVISPIVMQEDPILLDTVYFVEGRAIGYLVYNRFISSLATELNNTFSDFKVNGITELVLDLRYNPGGSVGTATLLASLIAPSEFVTNEDIFIKYIWNDILDKYWREKEGDDSENLIIKFLNTSQNINLHSVYVLVSESSASASELIINGLRPYMDVILVGDTTHGKYTASITLHEEEESFNWAIQPIVLKTANINNETDYKNGIFPDYYIEDDYFSALGSLEEDRLAYAVSLITGIPVGLPARRSAMELLPPSVPVLSGGYTDRNNEILLDADNIQIH